MSVAVYFTAHLVAKQAMDEVDLIPRFAWFGRDPEIKVANPCIQLLFKCQILGVHTSNITAGTGAAHLVCFKNHANSAEICHVVCHLNSLPGSWTTSP